MSRHRSNGSYAHKIYKERDDEYVLSWRVDRYYDGMRGRFPHSYRRDTNTAGALRFAKKHRIAMPGVKLK